MNLMKNWKNLVSLHMKRQMITSGELSFAQMALEGFRSGVFAVVPRQFVRSGKFPRAAFPRTLVGFLTRVSPLMSF